MNEQVEKEKSSRHRPVAGKETTDGLGNDRQRIDETRPHHGDPEPQRIPGHHEPGPGADEPDAEEEDPAHPGARARPPLARLSHQTHRMEQRREHEGVGGVPMQRPDPRTEPRVGRQPRDRLGRRADPVDEQEIETGDGQDEQQPGRQRAALVERVSAPAIDAVHQGVEGARHPAQGGFHPAHRPKACGDRRHLVEYISSLYDIYKCPLRIPSRFRFPRSVRRWIRPIRASPTSPFR